MVLVSVGIKSHVEKSCPQVFEAVSSQGQTRFALPSGHFFVFCIYLFFFSFSSVNDSWVHKTGLQVQVMLLAVVEGAGRGVPLLCSVSVRACRALLLGGNGPHGQLSQSHHGWVGFCTSKLVERYLPSTLAVITSLHEVASRYSYLYFFTSIGLDSINQSINHNRTVLYLVRQLDRDMVHVSHLPKLQKAVETCQIQECRISMLLQQSRHSTAHACNSSGLSFVCPFSSLCAAVRVTILLQQTRYL